MFDEDKHPRDGDRKFTDGRGEGSREEYRQSVNDRIKWAKENGVELPLNTDGSVDDLKLQEKIAEKKKALTNKVVKVDMDADIQKQFDRATPKDRQYIAFKYIMDNLRGKYPAEDGRVVAIEKVGADKMSHTLNETKIRVLPELAKLIEAGELEGVVEAQKEGGQSHKLFKKFAYYKVPFQIGEDKYIGRLNVGIREDGSSTLYDLNPFNKQ